MKEVPKNWPKNFIYTRRTFSRDLHPVIFSQVFLGFASSVLRDENISIEVHPHIEIRILKDEHPLVGRAKHPKKRHQQRGVFATQDIPAETFIGEYVGEVYLAPKLDFPGNYIWISPLQGNFFLLDASKYANELAFINDYRGISSKSNLRPVLVQRRGLGYFGYQTREKVLKGQELLVNYSPMKETSN